MVEIVNSGVNILQKEEDFVWGIFGVTRAEFLVLGGKTTKCDNFKKNN